MALSSSHMMDLLPSNSKAMCLWFLWSHWITLLMRKQPCCDFRPLCRSRSSPPVRLIVSTRQQVKGCWGTGLDHLHGPHTALNTHMASSARCCTLARPRTRRGETSGWLILCISVCCESFIEERDNTEGRCSAGLIPHQLFHTRSRSL